MLEAESLASTGFEDGCHPVRESSNVIGSLKRIALAPTSALPLVDIKQQFTV